MNLILAIVDFVLVGLYISLSMKNEGKSKNFMRFVLFCGRLQGLSIWVYL